MLRRAAAARYERLEQKYPHLVNPPPPPPTDGEAILDFQVELSPQLHRPSHFKRYAACIESAVGAGLRLVFAAPPQHGKTEITLHGLVSICKRHPSKRHAYITYNQKRSNRVAKKFRRLLRLAGVPVKGTLDCQELPGGGQVLFTSIDGGITGEPVDGVAIIDDPFKGRKEADSATRREDVEDSYRNNIETRVHAGGSILLLATRWHPEDLSGTLIKEGWTSINLPAIAENDNGTPDPNGREVGEALFPAMWPLEALAKKREAVLEFTWAALYQGRPRPKGGNIFHGVTWYTELPKVYRGAFGVDLAYSLSTRADMSVCLELWRAEQGQGADGQPLPPRFYVVKVERAKVEAPQFADVLHHAHKRKPRFPMLWRASGTEKGSADFIRSPGVMSDKKTIRPAVPLHIETPPGDKIVSSTEVAVAWNAGLVLVPDLEVFPEAEAWLYAFLDIIGNFTGSGKEHDDDVDALASAHHSLKVVAWDPPGGGKKKSDERESARDMVGF